MFVNKIIALVIAEFGNDRYIMDCIKSIHNQSLPLGWKLDLRIGVDGNCNSTKVLKNNKVPFYYSNKNVGAYIMRNSLIYLNKAEIYSYFDSDDIMSDGYLFRVIMAIQNNDKLTMTRFENYEENMYTKIPNKGTGGHGGAMSFSHNILEKLGGYKSHRVSSDSDFIKRYEAMSSDKITLIEDKLYKRRRHCKSATGCNSTGLGSVFRNNIEFDMQNDRNNCILDFEKKLKSNIISGNDLNNVQNPYYIKPDIINLSLGDNRR